MSPASRRVRRGIALWLAAACAVPVSWAVTRFPAGGQSVRGNSSFDASVDLVTLSVSVLDGHGVPIDDLTADDFIIFEDGGARTAAMVLTPDETPLDVALLVDLSGSMRNADWRDRARDFLEALSDDDCAFLLGFSTTVGGSVWGRPDDDILVDALEDADAAGGTALFDALLIALRELAAADTGGTLRGAARGALNPDVRGAPAVGVRPKNPCPSPLPPGREDDPEYVRRKAVVVVSDGADSSSRGDADAVLTAAELGGIPIFPIQLDGPGTRRGVGGAAPGRGAALPGWASEGVLPALAAATGGKTVRGSMSGYEEVLGWLRGSYVVGYYASTERDPADNAEFTRHEVRVELKRPGAEIIHTPAYFRRAIDTEAARYDVEQARDLIAEGQLDAAVAILGKALRADPDYAPAYFNRAIALADSGHLDEAHRDALQAAGRSPGVADMHELAMLISVDVGDGESAWEQAIRAVQAGADLRPHIDRLKTLGPAPADFDARVAAPTIMVARPYTEITNLLIDTALAKVMQVVRQQLAAVPRLGIVVDPSLADFVMTIRGDRLAVTRPRSLEGQMIVSQRSGDEVYKKTLRLNDVDSSERIAQDIGRFLRDLEDKLSGR